MRNYRKEVDIETVTVRHNGKPEVMYSVAVAMQDTPYIDLETLVRLRDLCNKYIEMGKILKPADSADLVDVDDRPVR